MLEMYSLICHGISLDRGVISFQLHKRSAEMETYQWQRSRACLHTKSAKSDWTGKRKRDHVRATLGRHYIPLAGSILGGRLAVAGSG